MSGYIKCNSVCPLPGDRRESGRGAESSHGAALLIADMRRRRGTHHMLFKMSPGILSIHLFSKIKSFTIIDFISTAF